MAPRLAYPLFLALLSAASASAGDGVDGRYGHTEIRYVDGKPAVFHQSRKVLAIEEADAAAIFRVLPGTSQDLVVIQSWKPEPNCHNSYRLLRIQANAQIQASPEFGGCTDFAGISFAGPYPVIQLRPTAAQKISQLMWKDGALVELPPVTAACFAKHEQAVEKGARLEQQAGFVAAGEGRLQFHSAPDERCEIAGTFVVPGDHLEASRAHGRYTLVVYRHPKTAKVAAGWVESARLKPIN